MAGKYYAVREGRKTGIYTDWNETKKQVMGYPKAKYKSFTSMKDAEIYMDVDNNKNKVKPGISEKLSLQAYVDGSFSQGKNLYSYGVVLLNQQVVIAEIADNGNDSSLLPMRNVAGEILGAMTAIEWAVEHRYEQIEIFYDYLGIEMWAIGEWKTNKEGTKNYAEFISKYKNKINIVFNKVKAHTGVEYNERADRLAAQAMHISEKIMTSDIHSSKELPFETISPYEEIFYEIMEQPKATSEETIITIKNYVITEKRLENFVKKCWKHDGHKIKEISEKHIELNLENRLVTCRLVNHDEGITKYVINV